MRSHLDDLIIAKLVVVHVVINFIVASLSTDLVHVELFIDLCDNKIKDRNDVGRVVLDLTVEHLIELEDMVAVNIEYVAIKFSHITQLLNIVWCPLELLVVIVIIVVS